MIPAHSQPQLRNLLRAARWELHDAGSDLVEEVDGLLDGVARSCDALLLAGGGGIAVDRGAQLFDSGIGEFLADR